MDILLQPEYIHDKHKKFQICFQVLKTMLSTVSLAWT